MSASTLSWRDDSAAWRDESPLEGDGGEADLSDDGVAEVPPPPRSAPPPSLSIDRRPIFISSNLLFFHIFYLSLQYFDGISPVFGEALGSLPGHVKPLAISLEDCGLLELLSHKGFSRKLIALITKNGSELTAQYTPAWVLLKSFKVRNVIAVLRQLR
jgi:hypothetical protein